MNFRAVHLCWLVKWQQASQPLMYWIKWAQSQCSAFRTFMIIFDISWLSPINRWDRVAGQSAALTVVLSHRSLSAQSGCLTALCYASVLLSFSRAQHRHCHRSSRLCDKAAVLWWAINETPCMYAVLFPRAYRAEVLCENQFLLCFMTTINALGLSYTYFITKKYGNICTNT